MNSVLCYGDSLTWRFNPADGTRFPFDSSRAVRASDAEGVHLDAEGHRKLGTAVAEIISSADRASTHT